MTIPPAFASLQEYRARLADLSFWWPHLATILQCHDLTDATQEPVAGHNVTYPTFLYGDIVVKLFGYLPSWRQGHAAEHAVYIRLATAPEIAAPRLLGHGQVYDAEDAPWPYLITSRMPGVTAERAELAPDQWHALAADLGREVRHLHALPTDGIATHAEWATVDLTDAARRSSLPPHLVAQVEAYIARLGPFDPAFLHSDIVANHVYVEDGRFAGIIDWGDALVADRHQKLIQIYRDTLHCDKALFRVFLDAANWPAGRDFPLQALGHALHRQAIGLAQHPTIDVFMPIAERYPLQDIPTLDDLASLLFAV